MVLQDLLGLGVSRRDDGLDLFVNLRSGPLGVVADVAHFLAQERVAVVGAVGDGPQLVAHAVLGHHGTGDLGGPLDVVGCAGGDVIQHQSLGNTAAQQHHQLFPHLVPALVGPVLRGQVHGIATCHTPRDNGDLVDRILGTAVIGGNRMASLVVRGKLLFLFAHDTALLLRTHHHLDSGLLDLFHGDGPMILPGCQQGGFVEKVLQVGAGKAGGGLGNGGKHHVGSQGLALGVDPQNFLTALDVGITHHHLSVKPAGTHQGGIQDVGAVGGGDHDDTLVGAKTVHFHQQLVQGLLTLVVTAAQASASLAAHGVDLIDENDAGMVFLGFIEQVADTGSAHAHKHFHKVRTGNGEEGHTGFTSHGPGQQGFTGTGRAHQQHTLGDPGAQGVILVGIFEELHDLPQFFLFLISAGHVSKGGLSLFVAHLLDLGFAEVHLLVAAHAAAKPSHHDHPEDDQAHKQNQRGQQADKPAGFRRPEDILHHLAVRMVLIVLVDVLLNVHVEQIHTGEHIANGLPILQRNSHFPSAQVQLVFAHLLGLEVIDNVRVLIGRLLGRPVVEKEDDDKQHHHRDPNIQQQVSDLFLIAVQEFALLSFNRTLSAFFPFYSYTEGFNTPTKGRLRYFSS